MRHSEAIVDVELPEGYGEVVDALAASFGDVVVLHAKLDVRASQVATALALRDALELGLQPVVFTDDRATTSYRVHGVLSQAGILLARRTYEGSTVFLTRDHPPVWVVDERSLEERPYAEVDRIYVVAAHDRSAEVGKLKSRLPRLIFTHPTTHGHWVRDVIAMPKTRVVPMDAARVVSMFPEQHANLIPQGDPLYDRMMMLRDVPVRYSTSGFRRFARTRLKVRTDKKRELLDATQQAEASQQHGTPIVSMRLNSLQRRYLARKRLAVAQGRPPWFLVLKSRRVGMTTLEQGLSYHVAVTQPHSYVAMLAHESAQTTRSFGIARLFAERDPKAPPLVSDTRTGLAFANGSQFFIGTAGGRTFGRGDTLQRGHGSESAFWCPGPNQDESARLLVAGLQGAASNGELVLESTANGHNWFYHYWCDAIAGKNRYTPIFMPWFEDPMNRLPAGTFNVEEIRSTLTDEEKELVARVGLGWDQVAFRREAQKGFGVLFPQEYPEDSHTAFLSYGTCFFDVDAIAKLQKRMVPPIITERVTGGTKRVWHRPAEGHRYAIAVDTSEGVLGGDFGVIAVLDLTTGQQAACLHGHFSPRLMGDLIAKTLESYPGMIGVERESFGNAVILRLGDLGLTRPHYHGGPLFHFAKDRPGWTTNEATRSQALDALAEAITSDGAADRIRDEIMLNECLSFRLQRSGKFEADKQAHDDAVMAWAIAHALRRAVLPKPRIHVVDDEERPTTIDPPKKPSSFEEDEDGGLIRI